MEDADGQPVLAIDLGGTQIRAALVLPDLEVACRRAEPTLDHEGVEAVVERICAVAIAVRDEARDAGLAAPAGIGISSPGPLDARRGIVIEPPNLAGWHNVPLSSFVEQAVGLPTFLERDTNVALMAEWRYGAAKGTDHAIYVTVSTGIGGALVANGRPVYGPDGAAGEVGHLVVELDGPICGCGRPGHVEAIGAGAAIAREGRALIAANASPRLADLVGGDADRVDARLVAQCADEGDAACRAILHRAWVAIGATFASLLNLLNPEVIVLGGSIAQHRPDLREVARAEMTRRAFAVPASRVRLEMAHFGDDVSLIGALPIVHERMTQTRQGAATT